MSKKPVYKPKPHALEELFGRTKVIIGVIHSKALPGSPNYEGEPVEEILQYAIAEAQRYTEGGVNGLIVENHGDIPFLKPNDIPPETVALMSVMTDRVRQATHLPVGVNLLANAAIPAIAVSKAAGAQFIRVNQWANAYVANEGIVEGPAAQATRYRAWLREKGLKIFADVHVKHGAHAIVADRSIAELTRDVEFFDADVVIATGQRTGDAATLDEIQGIKDATVLPVVLGSGVTEDNVADLLTVADGVVVASSLKRDGVWWNEVDSKRLISFMKQVNKVR